MNPQPMIRQKTLNYQECRIYMGAREGFDGPAFTKIEVIAKITEFQKTQAHMIPIRITDTTYLAGDYTEHGFEITTIGTPKVANLLNAMRNLGTYLLLTFKQAKITLIHQDSSAAPLLEIIEDAAIPNPLSL